LTTQENFWCVLKCGMRALFIGEEVDENGKVVQWFLWTNMVNFEKRNVKVDT